MLIVGEPGSGVDLVARALHYNGPRRDGPFVEVDCSVLPPHLLEFELFGYEKGSAAVGGASYKVGLAESADKGTLFIRDIMVKNGDAHKPIWISEMNWSAVPADFPDKRYGYVTPEQQARNVVDAYQRAQAEWPWVGVVNYWFFKRATDAEKDQAWYYFRMAEPDFTLMPVYYAVKEYANQPPVMYPGYHQEDHWAIEYSGNWETRADQAAVLGNYRLGQDETARLSFTFHGTDLWLQVGPGAGQGTMLVTLDGGSEQKRHWRAGERMEVARHLSDGPHQVTIRAYEGQLPVDGFIVRREPYWWLRWVVGLVMIVGLAGWLVRRLFSHHSPSVS